MMRALFSGVSGLRNHQVQMDVIGNNIANVNTVGFKSSRALFQELLSQTLKTASGPAEGKGGTNPQQVGLGMRISSIDNIFTQGNLMSTEKKTDLGIQGSGFFILSDGESKYYTRAGSFDFDKEGNLVNLSNGYKVQGYMADDKGELGKVLEDINIDFQQRLPASATTQASFVGNLNSEVEPTYAASTTLLTKLFDKYGNPMNLHIGDTITFSGSVGGTDLSTVPDNSYTITENSSLSDLAYALQTAIREAGGGSETVMVKDDGSLQVTAGSAAITGLKMECSGKTEFNSFGNIGDIAADAQGSTEKSRSADYTTFVTTYDSLGTARIMTFLFAKDTESGVSNTWNWQAIVPYDEANPPIGDTGSLTFNTDGSLASVSTTQITFDPDGTNVGADEMKVYFNFGTINKFNGITQFASDFSVTLKEQNGYPSGSLDDIAIDDAGVITGIFTNGINRTLAQVAIANFSNPEGLSKVGDNFYQQTLNSGSAQIGAPGTGTRGIISPSSLEMSNVDLAKSFTEIIIAQRGFQVNARVITAADQILQELVNIKR